MANRMDPAEAEIMGEIKIVEELTAELKALKNENPDKYRAYLADLLRIVHQRPTMNAKYDHLTEITADQILSETLMRKRVGAVLRSEDELDEAAVSSALRLRKPPKF